MAKAIRFHKTGGPEVLAIETVEVGAPGPGQARVRHTYVAVNFIDIYFRTGRYPHPLPAGLGSDAVGVVEAVGDGVTDIRVGQRVGYLLGPQGAYSDVRLMPADVLIPLPDGTSYNCYFVAGSDGNALIDTVDPAKCDTLMAQLDELPAPDYLVIHHVEQDHSGCAPLLLERFPELTIVCNEKARAMLIDHLHVDDARFQVVADGDTLSLGDKTLTFLFTPWVHWPETMST